MTDGAQKEIAALRAELDRLKPTEIDDAAMRQWQSNMHNIREGRMAQASAFSRADLEAMEAAAPTSVVKGIALRDARAPTGRPGTIPSSQQQPTTSVRPEGNRSGWVEPAPLGPMPGVAQADRLMAAEDREFRRQRIVEEAQRQELFEEKKPSGEASDDKTNP